MTMPADKKTAFEQRLIAWADKHLDALYGYALQRVHHHDIAEEMVQETFLAATKGHKKFSGKSTDLTWLIGILPQYWMQDNALHNPMP